MTAADGTTTEDHSVTLRVAAGGDGNTNLSYIKINGWWASDNQTRYLSAGATDVTVELQTADSGASYEITGRDQLVTGVNVMTVKVTSGGNVGWHYFYLIVPDVSGLSPGLDVQVYNSQTENPLSGAVMPLCDGADTHAYLIQADWGDGVTAGCQPDDVVVRYTGYVTFPDSGLYSFRGWADDGFYMSLDGKGIITQDWAEKGASGTTYQNVPIIGGHKYTFEAWFYEHRGQATVTLQYDPANGDDPQTPVPAAYFSADGTFPPTTAGSNTGASLSIHAQTVADGDTYTASPGDTSVDVNVTLDNPYASYQITGNTGLISGQNNTVTVTVTSVNGTTQDYNFTVYVPSSSDSSLGFMTANGSIVDNGGTYPADFGTTSVDVSAYVNESHATASVSGNTDLHTGTNHVTVVVTAQDGSTTTYGFDIIVADASTDSSAGIQINGTSVVDGDTFYADGGVTSVSVDVFTNEAHATSSVTGADNLQVGDNTVTVVVTAQDGSTTTYTFTVNVPRVLSSDTSLASVTVDGNDNTGLGTLIYPAFTTSVNVEAAATNVHASTSISGTTGFENGHIGTVSIVVTAEDGSTQTYTFSVVVLNDDNSSLDSMTANGENVIDGGTYNVDNGVQSVDVVATPSSVVAYATVSGNTDLHAGANHVTVVVFAQSGSSTTYGFDIVVALSSDSSLGYITVDGNNGAWLDSTINMPYGTTSISVDATPPGEGASAVVTGNTDLHAGINHVTIVVTAQDGSTSTYGFDVFVADASTDSSAGIQINGTSVVDGDTFYADGGVTSVSVDVFTNEAHATSSVTGADNLQVGDNTVTVVVTAQDGSTTTYTFTVNVAFVPSNDSSLAVFTVNGDAVVNYQTIHLPYGTGSVDVVATPTSEFATAEITGATRLFTGDNLLTVVVTAEDETTSTYEVDLHVDALSSDSLLASLTVNGEGVFDGATYEVPNGTTSVEIAATTNDAGATFTIDGGSSLTTGDNQVTVTVTAADGSQSVYSFVVRVLELSGNTDLSAFIVNGTQVSDNDTISLPYGTTFVSTSATTSDAAASVTISGNTDLVSGVNQVTALVTAANGNTYSHTVNVEVAYPSNDASVAEVTVNGEHVDANGTIHLAPGTTSATIVVTTNDSNAYYTINGGRDLVTGAAGNAVTVDVLAQNGVDETWFNFTIVVDTVSSDSSLSNIYVNGGNVAEGSSVTVPYGTPSVDVSATANDTGATVAVSGNTGLHTGTNHVTIVITAQDGSTSTYGVDVVVTENNDTSLSLILVNGLNVSEDNFVTIGNNATTADVAVTTTDPNATFEISDVTALQNGDNLVTITVTAADGVTSSEHFFTIKVY